MQSRSAFLNIKSFLWIFEDVSTSGSGSFSVCECRQVGEGGHHSREWFGQVEPSVSTPWDAFLLTMDIKSGYLCYFNISVTLSSELSLISKVFSVYRTAIHWILGIFFCCCFVFHIILCNPHRFAVHGKSKRSFLKYSIQPIWHHQQCWPCSKGNVLHVLHGFKPVNVLFPLTIIFLNLELNRMETSLLYVSVSSASLQWTAHGQSQLYGVLNLQPVPFKIKHLMLILLPFLKYVLYWNSFGICKTLLTCSKKKRLGLCLAELFPAVINLICCWNCPGGNYGLQFLTHALIHTHH